MEEKIVVTPDFGSTYDDYSGRKKLLFMRYFTQFRQTGGPDGGTVTKRVPDDPPISKVVLYFQKATWWDANPQNGSSHN